MTPAKNIAYERTERFLQIFLVCFMIACIAFLAFVCYVMYRQSNAPDNPFDPSIIHSMSKTLVLIGMVAGLLGVITVWWTLVLVGRRSTLVKVMVPLLLAIAVLILVAGYWYLARTESRYLFRSRYFKWFLYGGVPMAGAMVFGGLGIIRLLRTGLQTQELHPNT